MKDSNKQSNSGTPPSRAPQHISELIIPTLDQIAADQEALFTRGDLEGARARFNGLLQVIQAGDSVTDEQLDAAANNLEQAWRNYDDLMNPQE